MNPERLFFSFSSHCKVQWLISSSVQIHFMAFLSRRSLHILQTSFEFGSVSSPLLLRKAFQPTVNETESIEELLLLLQAAFVSSIFLQNRATRRQ